MSEAMVESDLVAEQGDDAPLGATFEDGAVKGPEKCYCPYGCTLEDCDEHGYCEHLMGFTNDKKAFEPIIKIMAWEEDPADPTKRVQVDTGKRRVVGRKKIQLVQKGDQLVNPTKPYFDSQNGGWKVKNLWVSWRVYRKNPVKDKAASVPAA